MEGWHTADNQIGCFSPSINIGTLLQVIVLNGEGKALSVARGLVTAGELQQSLADAVASFQRQVALVLPLSNAPTLDQFFSGTARFSA